MKMMTSVDMQQLAQTSYRQASNTAEIFTAVYRDNLVSNSTSTTSTDMIISMPQARIKKNKHNLLNHQIDGTDKR